MKKLVVIALVILALLSAVVAVVYFTKTAGNLPHFYPGYLKGSGHKHLKHGVVFLGLTVVLLLASWMLSGNSKEQRSKKSSSETPSNS